MNSNNKLGSRLSYPRWLVIQLLERCNLRCKMCYEWGENGSYLNKDNLAQLDIDLVKKIIEDCSPVKPMIELFGGEPLLYPQIDEVFAAAKYYDCKMNTPTNGVLLSKYADMLIENEAERIWVSLDGPENINDEQRGKGSYKKAVDGIKKIYELKQELGKNKPEIGIIFCITPSNFNSITQFFINDLDLKYIDLISFEFQMYITKQQYDQYLELLTKKFNISKAPIVKGLIVDDITCFKSINILETINQINYVKKASEKQDVKVYCHPEVLEVDELTHYFSANWSEMKQNSTRCSLPWVYLEIAATGDVSVCHSFYDLSFGNVNQESILDIWRGERINQFRNHMRKNILPVCTACPRYYNDLI